MEIKRISINDAQAGLLVAENIYNSSDQLIVPKDTVITDKAIARMRFHSISTLRVYFGNEAPEPSGDSASFSYFDRLRETDEFIEFNRNFSQTTELFKANFRQLFNSKSGHNSEPVVKSTEALISSCRTKLQLFDLIHCTRKYDDITFAHSLNVAMIASTLGAWLGFSQRDIDVLIECGIYHDIGKLLLPDHIVNKPSALTTEEYATVKSHTTKGYLLLKEHGFDPRVSLCAMMHHERCDGTGYPLKLVADQMQDFPKIIAIADVYEAMTSPRIYRKPICPFDVIKHFETEGLSYYDPRFLMTFLDNIAQSYLGNKVLLNDGTTGTVVYINKFAYSRPMIDIDGKKYIDLSKDMSKHITAVL